MSIPTLSRASLLTMAADLLDMAGDEFGNHGCNDWEPNLNEAEDEAFAVLAWVHNGKPKDEEPHPVRADFVAMYTCARELRKLAEEAKR